MPIRLKFICTSIIAALISGCGGGASTDPAASVKAAFIPGAYRTVFNCAAMAQGTLIDDNDKLYQVCGTQLSVGSLSGTIPASKLSTAVATGSVKFTVFDSGTPASTQTIQAVNGPFTYTIPAGKPSVTTGPVFSGALFTNAQNYVFELNFSDNAGKAGSISFDSKWVGDNPVGSIMAGYSTLAGSYVAYIPEQLAVDKNDSLAISSSGVITGTSVLGAISGQITKFNAGTGVHDISITLTPSSGAGVVMTGVIGPVDVNMTGAAQFTNYSGLLLAVSGTGAGFYKIFKHL